jgi:Papain family cysteine protease
MTDSVFRKIIDEHIVDGKRLGRHIEHDPRSKDFAYDKIVKPEALAAVEHKRHGSIFNQGQLGSCTGNAACGAKNTEPLYHSGSTHLIAEAGAVDIYSLATRLDGLSDGYYPPTDTGSSGLAVSKAMKQEGMIGSYQHAFDMDAALSALQAGPVITGVDWYEGFDNPDANGLVEISGQIRGGHEICPIGYEPQGSNPDDALIKIANSWGTTWGVSGYFFWTVGTWKQLLANGGDVTILVP